MELRGLAVVVALAPATAASAQQAATAEGSAASSGSATHNAGSAGEQKVASDPPTLGSDVLRSPRRESPPPFPNAGIGARIGYGWAYADGVPDSFLLRLDYEAFFYIAPRHTVGGLVGFIYGFDWWHAKDKVPDNWGFANPVAVVGGMRVVIARAYVGVGVNAITIDQIDDDTGFGFCSPMALANIGLDIYGFTAMFDTRVARRWQIGSPDITQWVFSIMIGATLEAKHNRAFFEGRPVDRHRPDRR